ncbi:TonB-dependent receptor [Sphingobium sp. Sx8-8]|uniref:TonB-dependent receptor n=1 Tax=Sphingobium sp. Sx8-8 TaxID=2933617 RepID=UPI001F566EA5|nr:TonB-dependent receptor [Sphingobium sp. Sx8-8]
MIDRAGRALSVSLFAVAVSLGVASPAFADAPAAPAADAKDGGDIVVTATRRDERAVDVPIAVSSLSNEKLNAINSSGLDIRFLSGRVPSLLAESSFGRTFPRFYIRGLGNTDFHGDAQQPVSVVYDNIAVESPFLKAFPAFDLENIEVLKGPQGTLFGRNTPAGVIKLTSARPTEDFTGHASVSWGTFNTVNSEAAISGPINDKLRFRVSGLLQRRDDWVTNDYAATMYEKSFEGYRDLAGRAQLEYEDGPLDVLLNFHIRSLRGTARLFRANIIKQGTDDFVDGFDIRHAAQDGSNPQRLDGWGSNAQISYKLDGLGTVYSITGWEKANVYSRGDIDGGYGASYAPPYGPGFIPFSVETGSADHPREFTQELRFVSEKFGDVRFQGGAYYFNQNYYEDQGGSWDLAGTFTPGDNSSLHSRTFALYGSLEYTPVDNLILRGGLRWSHDERQSYLYNGNDIASSTDVVSGKVSGSKWSWDLSATYKLTGDMSVYARAASGYLGAAIHNDISAGISTTARPQTTTSYEIGFKGGGSGINYSIDAYYFNTRDIQLTAVGGGSNVTRLLNAKKAIGYGVEAELSAKPTENLDITLGGSYNFTEIKDPNLYVAPCGASCTVTDPLVVVNGSTLAAINGNPLPQAPRWILNATVGYAVPIGDQKELFAYTDWAYRSKVDLFLYRSIEFTGKAFLEGGLRAGYRDKAKNWEVAAFARNITNQIRIIGAIDFNNLTGMVNEPRIIGGEFKIGF